MVNQTQETQRRARQRARWRKTRAADASAARRAAQEARGNNVRAARQRNRGTFPESGVVEQRPAPQWDQARHKDVRPARAAQVVCAGTP